MCWLLVKIHFRVEMGTRVANSITLTHGNAITGGTRIPIYSTSTMPHYTLLAHGVTFKAAQCYQ